MPFQPVYLSGCAYRIITLLMFPKTVLKSNKIIYFSPVIYSRLPFDLILSSEARGRIPLGVNSVKTPLSLCNHFLCLLPTSMSHLSHSVSVWIRSKCCYDKIYWLVLTVSARTQFWVDNSHIHSATYLNCVLLCLSQCLDVFWGGFQSWCLNGEQWGELQRIIFARWWHHFFSLILFHV